MIKAFKGIITILPILATAFSQTSNNNISEEYYYNLKFLKDSNPPREMKIVRIDNLAYKKSLVEIGVLITYNNRHARDVKIAGDFSNWQNIKMDRGKYGVWYYFLSEFNRKKAVRYKFLVDGIWIMDPKNPYKEDDLIGSYVSIVHPIFGKEGKQLSFRFINRYLVEFRIYRPKARLISIVGDFNNWNPENDLLVKGKDDIWRLKKRLAKGTYRYKYIIDGKWVNDLYNKNTAWDSVVKMYSLISVK